MTSSADCHDDRENAAVVDYQRRQPLAAFYLLTLLSSASRLADAKQQAQAEAALLQALHQHQATHPANWTPEQIARARRAAAIAAQHQAQQDTHQHTMGEPSEQ